MLLSRSDLAIQQVMMSLMMSMMKYDVNVDDDVNEYVDDVYDDVDEGLIAMGARGGGLGNKENQVSANTTLEVINT
jgi:hypothetical protein